MEIPRAILLLDGRDHTSGRVEIWRNLSSTGISSEDIYTFVFGQKGLMAGLGVQGNKIAKITPK